MFQRFLMIALVFVGQRDIGVGLGVFRLLFECLGNEEHGLVRPKLVDAQHAQQVQGMDVASVLFQHLEVFLLGQVSASCLVQAVSAFQQIHDVVTHTLILSGPKQSLAQGEALNNRGRERMPRSFLRNQKL